MSRTNRTNMLTDTPDLSPLPGCHLVEPLPGTERTNVYVSGEPDGQRIRVRYYRRDSDGAIVAPCWFGPGCEGPPGHAHGGSLAALLDELMGVAAWNEGHAVVLARLTTNNRAMLPLRTVVLGEAQVESVDGRKVEVRAKLVDTDGRVFVEADGLFVTVGLDRFRELFAQSR